MKRTYFEKEHYSKKQLGIKDFNLLSSAGAVGFYHECEGAQEHLFPKNVGLFMFSENPKQFYPEVQIDVVEFPYGVGAKEFNEKTFDGPIQKQLTDALSYMNTNIIKSKVKKYADREESEKIFNYPYAALEEALANAVYHRNYELTNPFADTLSVKYRYIPISLRKVGQ